MFQKKSLEADMKDPSRSSIDTPLHGSTGIEEQAFTFRAVIVGTLLGSVIGASNMYMGLTVGKISRLPRTRQTLNLSCLVLKGWTFGASLFGSIVGFAILKPLSKIVPAKFGGASM